MLWGGNRYFQEFVLYLLTSFNSLPYHWLELWSEFWRLANQLKGSSIFWFTDEILEFNFFFPLLCPCSRVGKKSNVHFFPVLQQGKIPMLYDRTVQTVLPLRADLEVLCLMITAEVQCLNYFLDFLIHSRVYYMISRFVYTG